ncbi:translation initiation factor IF-3, mitochondrial isoform X2 [Lucilia cuprina]|uniref:translation initiation factor IF-3, mitochondrial isoform X2 n=1 Tax=Lucilia cuprina TaxID=7375 RepID=UPI001F0590CC|nr:translation initiation factor IF-3, mitochondrial isoform X2 [Lucilia cuprina]
MAFLLRNSLKFSWQKQLLNACSQQKQQLQKNGFKTSSFLLNPHKQNPNTTQENGTTANAQKKHKESMKITLIQNQNMTVTALEEAQSLAKRRSMHLVKVQDMDAKTQRPVYKLLTAAEMLQSELSDKSSSAADKTAGKKSEKSLNIGSRIAEHDLASRLKNISKWLNKQHEVRILIQGNSQQDMANCEKIFKTIEESIKTPQIIGKIVQKRTKGNIVKFNILPVAPDTNVKADVKSQ